MVEERTKVHLGYFHARLGSFGFATQARALPALVIIMFPPHTFSRFAPMRSIIRLKFLNIHLIVRLEYLIKNQHLFSCGLYFSVRPEPEANQGTYLICTY